MDRTQNLAYDQANQIGDKARQMGERAHDMAESALHQEPLQGMFESMERIPSGAYYFAVGASIVTSAAFYIAGKRETAQFIGQWVPTFALLGLMNKLMRPSTD
jgi:hypothetical protein